MIAVNRSPFRVLLLTSLLALPMLLAGCSPDATVPVSVSVPSPPPPMGPRLVRGLSITAVTLNQGVAIDLTRDGAEPEERLAPVLVGRPGLVRVFVTVDEGWQQRAVLGQLTLSSQSSGVDLLLEDEVEVEGDSEITDFDTSFDFVFAASDLAQDTRLAVRLWELEEPEAAGAAGGAAWPALGSVPLDATEWGGVLRVQLLPFTYTADGSDRLPDTSPEQIQILSDNLRRLYPLRDLELEVLEPYAIDFELLPDGTGFSELLALVADLRVEWGIPFDTQVFGQVAPAPSLQAFCQFGCTAGLAYRVGNPRNAKFKSGLGLGYSGQSAARTLAHELGHIHDRPHAPCGSAGNADENFPYAGGGIGVAGWDIINEVWIDPSEHADLMGYCTPDWISDYTYAGLHRRLAVVEGLRASRDPLEKAPWLSFELGPGGQVSRPRISRFEFVPEGREHRVLLWDGQGRLVGQSAASLLRFGDGGAGTVVMPAPGPGVAAIQLEGYATLSL
jgi:hypothetical protein